ncbi:methyltransferase [Choiromyces venosus 120613-1]|uniref:Methyltransferase n=1 Tax=Choiromyces venosus 120613-1 TaxID=1336337 RepID=A0A3N4JS85_9PEZI|nr:methyltransferase [Choiromyces venosus 120613-1]
MLRRFPFPARIIPESSIGITNSSGRNSSNSISWHPLSLSVARLALSQNYTTTTSRSTLAAETMIQDTPTPIPLSTALPDIAQLSLEPDSPTPTTAPPPKDPKAPKDPTPFKFGTRLLTDPSSVFEHNAWDHVETDEAYRATSTAQISFQRSRPVDPFNKQRFNSHPAKWWDAFYENNKTNFFKDRKWLHQEFPLLEALTSEGAGPASIVELGCGAGNTLFPVLRLNRNQELCIHGCDFSRKAVELVRAQEDFTREVERGRVRASVYDLSQKGTLPEGVEWGSVDAVIMVFVFSALSPEQWVDALANVRGMLKKGGKVLFRDYGRGDLAQVRFKAGRYLDENFYVRGDGTRVYFFDQDELRWIFAGEKKEEGADAENTQKEDGGEQSTFPKGDFGGFKINDIGVDRRMLVNRKTQVKMYRCWMQAVFEKL